MVIVSIVAAVAVAGWLGHWLWGALAGVLFYLVSCIAHPYANCPWCDGHSKRRSEGGSVFHKCYVCKGSGSRLRLGTKVLRMVGVGVGGD